MCLPLCLVWWYQIPSYGSNFNSQTKEPHQILRQLAIIVIDISLQDETYLLSGDFGMTFRAWLAVMTVMVVMAVMVGIAVMVGMAVMVFMAVMVGMTVMVELAVMVGMTVMVGMAVMVGMKKCPYNHRKAKY